MELVSLSGAHLSPSVAGPWPPPLPGQVPGRRLVGRRSECDALDRLVAGVRAGQSQILVMHGEAGAGKTALLNYLWQSAAGCHVARVAGVESERELAFAGLHQLCGPFLDRLGCLPGPQREALDTAFGRRGGDAPDRFLTGMAVLGLLANVAGQQPLVCIVDDAQWLDRASALALGVVARHLVYEPVAVVVAVRQPGDEPHLTGLAELAVGGLADGDARVLLGSAIPGPLDERVRERIVAETRGNPRALLEMSRGPTPEQLAGGFGLPASPAVGSQAEKGFQRRLAALPPATRRLLLVAAAEPTADPVLVWRAAGLGAEAGAAAPAAAAGLIEFGGQVRFCHPLARSAVYRAATAEERHRAHRALADATDPGADPDRRAWHRAHAAPGLDEDAAGELERSAGRARARGGLAAAAAFGERAAELTPDPARRAQRALAAAHAKHWAGAPDAALRLLAMAQAGPLDELGRARAERLRARIEAGSGRGRDAPLLLQSARRLEPLHPPLARRTYRDAFYAALTAGRLAAGGGMLEVARAVRAGPPAPQPPRAPDVLLDGLAVLATEGYAAGMPLLRRALRAFRDQEVSAEEELGWLPLACRISHAVWDDESWHALSARLIELAREAGALGLLPVALPLGAAIQLVTGEFAAAAVMAEEAGTVAQATGSRAGPYGPLLLAAWKGEQTEACDLIQAATPRMVARGEGQWLTAAAWATAVASNGRGRYDEALAAAGQGSEHPAELGLATWSLAELIEAAARTGSPERASDALQRLSETTRASGTDWALGIEARSRALLSDGEPAERLYCEAIERLGRTRVRVELARAHLLYGEWLRRENRRVDARGQLKAAHGMLTAMGIEGFAARARRELLATGETVRRRAVEAVGQLTAQEAQIARLAGAGHTNPEISIQLFISPRTVEWHLHKVFTKLGVSSRKELRGALPDVGRAALPA